MDENYSVKKRQAAFDACIAKGNSPFPNFYLHEGKIDAPIMFVGEDHTVMSSFAIRRFLEHYAKGSCIVFGETGEGISSFEFGVSSDSPIRNYSKDHASPWHNLVIPLLEKRGIGLQVAEKSALIRRTVSALNSGDLEGFVNQCIGREFSFAERCLKLRKDYDRVIAVVGNFHIPSSVYGSIIGKENYCSLFYNQDPISLSQN